MTMVNVAPTFPEPDVRHDIIVVGGSAGGVEALTQLVRAFPADLPASVFVVVHIPPSGTSALPEILRRAGPVAALHAADGEPIYANRIYIAPPDRHLLVYPGRIRLSSGPRENRNRPAIDPLFRSAARAFGSRVTGVVLSGTLDDGVSGLAHIRKAGGYALVQDPREAAFPQMPQAAIDAGNADRIARVTDMASLIDLHARTGDRPEPAGETPAETRKDPVEQSPSDGHERAGVVAPYGCPDCGGALWNEGGDPPVLRCRIGHAYSEESLAAGQQENVEHALWAATRALAERVSLGKRMIERSERNEHEAMAQRYRDDVRDAQQHLEVIERLLFRAASEDEAEEEAASS